MITAQNFTDFEAMLEKAIKKAEKLNPKWRKIENEDGLWEVQSSNGFRWYQVRIGQKLDGTWFIACVCRGALEDNPCYHAGTIYPLAKKTVALREKVDTNNAPYIKQGTGKKTEKIGNIRI